MLQSLKRHSSPRTYRVNHVRDPPGPRPLRDGHRARLLVLLEHLVVVIRVTLEQLVLLRVLSTHLVRAEGGYLLTADSLGSFVRFRVVARSTRIHLAASSHRPCAFTATYQKVLKFTFSSHMKLPGLFQFPYCNNPDMVSHINKKCSDTTLPKAYFKYRQFSGLICMNRELSFQSKIM